MRVSYEWLKELVDFNLPPEELAECLTGAGIAVEAVEYPAEEFSGVVVARILRVQPHPASDHLLVCRVDAGGAEPLPVVTGAPNVRQGQVVVLALPGAVLPGGRTIGVASFRGVQSHGMLCSARELGLDDSALPPEQQAGILELPPDDRPGRPFTPSRRPEQAVLVLELTPNRSDCLAMVNVAREVAALTGGRLNLPAPRVEETGSAPAAAVSDVTVEAPDLCPRYVARLVEGVRVAPSPAWMQERLAAAGVRPINNIVDITNYVMLETGQPLHAFDLDRLAEHRIVVRRAAAGERLSTLDGVPRDLDPEMLVIADARRPVAIAGVMGGLDTEITAETGRVLLESAVFAPVSIRQTSRRLGLRSEASSRFEKGVDVEGCAAAADRAVSLMAELAGGRVLPGYLDRRATAYAPVRLTLRPRRVNQLLGTALGGEEIRAYLQRLPLQVREEGADLVVEVPSFRPDLQREEDLVEEVARLYGYENIPATLPGGAAGRPARTPRQRLEAACRDLLAGCGLQEVITYSFIHPRFAERLRLPEGHPWREVPRLQNPLSEEQGVLRPSLLPGLLEVAARNASRRVRDVALFELGRVFRPAEGGPLPEERAQAAALAAGELPRGWGWPARPLDFFYLKGVLEEMLQRLGAGRAEFRPLAEVPFFHPGRAAEALLRGTAVARLGELHPLVQEAYELHRRACYLEVDLEALAPCASEQRQYRSLPRYPAVERDLAVVLPEDVPVAAVEEAIRRGGGALLAGVRLFDVYRGAPVPEGRRSLAFSLTYRHPERTLTDQEVAAAHAAVQEALKPLGAELRGEQESPGKGAN